MPTPRSICILALGIPLLAGAGCQDEPSGGNAAPAGSSSVVSPAASAAPTPPFPIAVPCPATVQLLESLGKKMSVDAYVTHGTPSLDAAADELTGLLAAYKAASSGHFLYDVIDVKVPIQRQAAKDLGLLEQTSTTPGPDGGPSKFYLGVVFRYGPETDVLPTLSPDRRDWIELWVTNKIREVKDKALHTKHKIGVLVGDDGLSPSDTNLIAKHGEPRRGKTPSLAGILQQTFSSYELVDVDLKGGSAAVDETLSGLMVTQPGRDLTEKELRRIDQFVMKGKALAVFASSVNVAPGDATMTGTLNGHGLEKLLLGYGIELAKDVVLDPGRPFETSIPVEAGVLHETFPDFLHVAPDPAFTGERALLDTSYPPFYAVDALTLPFASSLMLRKERQPEATVMKVVARSSASAFHETTPTVDLKPLKRWNGKTETAAQYNVAATVEGTLTSAFSSREKPTAGKTTPDPLVDVPAKSAAPARIFVLASSEFLANPFALAIQGKDEAHPAVSADAYAPFEQLGQLYLSKTALSSLVLSVKGTLDWLVGDETACPRASLSQ